MGRLTIERSGEPEAAIGDATGGEGRAAGGGAQLAHGWRETQPAGPGRPIGRGTVIVVQIAVLDPFLETADHLINAPGIGLERVDRLPGCRWETAFDGDGIIG